MTMLLDTADHSTAILLGYDGPRSPADDGEGLQVSFTMSGVIPCVLLAGPDGSVELTGWAEVIAAKEALDLVLAMGKRRLG